MTTSHPSPLHVDGNRLLTADGREVCLVATRLEWEALVADGRLVFSLGGIAGVLTTAFWGTYGQKHGYFFVMALAFFGAGFFNLLQYLPESISLPRDDV